LISLCLELLDACYVVLDHSELLRCLGNTHSLLQHGRGIGVATCLHEYVGCVQPIVKVAWLQGYCLQVQYIGFLLLLVMHSIEDRQLVVGGRKLRT